VFALIQFVLFRIPLELHARIITATLVESLSRSV